jgi:hypothetical protein
VADDIVNDLRAISQFVGGAGPKLREAADLLDAVDALHKPDTDDDGFTVVTFCHECVGVWPCRTYCLLHPEEARRG